MTAQDKSIPECIIAGDRIKALRGDLRDHAEKLNEHVKRNDRDHADFKRYIVGNGGPGVMERLRNCEDFDATLKKLGWYAIPPIMVIAVALVVRAIQEYR